MATTLPARSQVDERFTWDRESVFPDEAGWEHAVETIVTRLPDLAEFHGHLGDSPDALADWFDANESVHRLMGKVMVYSTMSYSVDKARPPRSLLRPPGEAPEAHKKR